MLQKESCTYYGGGLKGAECVFAESAEKWGIKEVNFTFSGQQTARQKNLVVLSDEELLRGDISMELVAKMVGRKYYNADKIRKVLQAIFHMVNNGHQVFVVGSILEDNTVKGGTGWAVELAKLFNRPLFVYDQPSKNWYAWKSNSWEKTTPRITSETFVGSGTRYLTDDGQQAIEKLFEDTFGQA
ncbi:MAG: hypothetical protein A2511_03335 [Deltaproteobacteria bacterium RIFOXYD12_FULL_50_9]|nr:MAG: hypothetical protein A2511_03335 [Deltaproteobacteria bacterium RIFOXYD12_FULL_50_9]